MWTALPLWVVLYGVGIWLGWLLGVSPGVGRALAVAALTLAALARWRRRAPGLALLGAALALGTWAQARALARPPSTALAETLLALHEEGEAAPLAPLWAQGRVHGLPSTRGDGTVLRVGVHGVAATPPGPDDAGAWRSLSPPALVALTVRGPLREPLSPGDAVLFYAALRPPIPHQNPGDLDKALRAAIDGAALVASVDPAALIRRADVAPRLPGPAGAATTVLLRGVHAVRERFDQALRSALLPTDRGDDLPDHALQRFALVSALVIGQRGALVRADDARVTRGAPRISQVFRDAGVFHLLSVSGSHLAAFAFLFYSGLNALLLRCAWLALRVPPRRIAAAAAMPAVVFYTLLTGAEVATVRAAVVACVVFLAVACGRRGRLPEALAVAALLLLHPAANPLGLFDPALQLSFTAALGAAVLRPGQGLLKESAGGPPDRVARLARRMLRLCQISLGATLATAPLSSYHFGEVPLAGVLGNLFAVPLAEGVLIPAGLAGAALDGLWPAGGALLIRLAGGAAEVLLALTSEVAAWGLSPPMPPPGAPALGLWALGLLFLSQRRRAWPLPCALAALLCCAPRFLAADQLTATFLDVGQADAAVLELPGGAVVVVDAGEAPRGGGDGPVLSLLRRRAHRRIDLLVASHPHPDHIGGLPLLLDRFPVGLLWSTGGPHPFVAGGERPDPALALALAIAARRGVPVSAPAPLVLNGVSITPLWPCQPTAPGGCAVAPTPHLRHNDNSLVLRLAFAGRTLLLPGDVELPGELALLEQHDLTPGLTPGLLRADVLKAPHHCSRTSSSESLLRAVAPAVVVCSLGFHNRYRFPSPEVLARYDALGARIYRTDHDGAVQVRITPSGALFIRAEQPDAARHTPLR